MPKDWCDYTSEDDELLYSQEFNLMEALGLTPTNPHQASGPAEQVVHTFQNPQEFLTLEELEREQLGPQHHQRSKEDEEKGMALVMSRLQAASAAQARAREDLFIQPDELNNQPQSRDIEGLEKQVADLTALLQQHEDDSCRKSAEWKTEKQRLQQDSADLNSKLQEKSLENTALRERNSHLERIVAQLEKDRSSLELRHQKEAELKAQKLQELENMQTQVQNIVQTREKLQDCLRRSQEEHSILKKRYGALKKDLMQEVEQEKNNIAELQKENATILKSCQELSLERSLLEKKCSGLEELLRTSEKECSLLETKTTALQQQVEQDKLNRDDLLNEKAALLRTCDELKLQLSVQVETCDAVQVKLRRCEEKNFLLIANNCALEQEVKEEKHGRAQLENEKATMLNTSKDLEAERSLLVDRCGALDHALATTQEELSLLTVKNRALHQQVEQEHHMKTALEEEKIALVNTREKLNTELSLLLQRFSALEEKQRSTERQRSLLEEESLRNHIRITSRVTKLSASPGGSLNRGS
ncbi:cingulin-like [Boleophthalmus pectinirostris]|uniref:cingulin-like n=1 Tax=Boleophthalmus pectinirostris TaxID=150288 RepID=UPI00243329CB|nr:cingulin-like [Boleophthalmus pectinirostris]